MKDITIGQMLEMQKKLHERYPNWDALIPENGKDSLLWAYGEMAEVGDILKKQGYEPVMKNAQIRADFVEEICDVLMYLGDLMVSFDIKAEDIEESYKKKFERNMNRW